MKRRLGMSGMLLSLFAASVGAARDVVMTAEQARWLLAIFIICAYVYMLSEEAQDE